MQVNGRTADDQDNIIRNNTILRNAHGLKLYKQDSVLYSNTIKDNEGYGLQIDNSGHNANSSCSCIYLWNNTISNNEDDILVTGSSGVYSIVTIFYCFVSFV